MNTRTLTRTVLLLTAALALFAAPVARAAVVIHVNSVTAASPSTGSLDIVFKVTGSNPQLAGFQLKLDLSPLSSGVAFTSAAFAPNETGNFAATTLFDFSPNNQSLQVAAAVATGQEQNILDGDGVLRVFYSVAPATSGVFNLTLDTTQTILSDPSAAAIPYTVENGSITIQGAGGGGGGGSVVPLPLALYSGIFALGMAGLFYRRLLPVEDAAH